MNNAAVYGTAIDCIDAETGVLMKLRIIKRMDREKMATEVPAANGRSKKVETRTAMAATVHSWIDELRQKRGEEQRLIQQLFKAEYSG